MVPDTDLPGFDSTVAVRIDMVTSAPLQIPELLPHPFAPSGPPTSWHRVEGRLVADAPAGSDLFIDPAHDGSRPDAPRLLAPVDDDFQLSARVSVDFAATFDAGVLLVYADATHWAKLCFEFTPQRRPSVVSVVTNGVSDDANAFELPDRSVWLRVSRIGRVFAFHASTDGTWWRLVRYFQLSAVPPGTSVHVGFLVQSPAGDGCRVAFDDLRFSRQPPTELRDGS